MEPKSLCLPEDVIHIIKEYSMPVTRADWKTNIVINERTLHSEFERQLCIRYRRLHTVHGSEFLRLLGSYKPIFDNNYYKNFKNHFYNFKIEL